jgi:hypothetical protein
LSADGPAGKVVINLEDFGLQSGLAFCESRQGYFQIPDPDFMGTRGYAVLRHKFSTPFAWPERRRIVFWRGADFGPVVKTAEELPRVQLCRIASRHPDLFDVGINDFRHGRFAEEIKAFSYVRDRVHRSIQTATTPTSTSMGTPTPGWLCSKSF